MTSTHELGHVCICEHYTHKRNLKIKERLEGRKGKKEERRKGREREGLPYGSIAKTKSFGSNFCAR